MVLVLIIILYTLDPKKFKEKLGMVIVYFGLMNAYLGFMWFGIIIPSTNKAIEQATPEELVELEVFLSNGILTMIFIFIGIFIFTIFLNLYFSRKESKKPCNHR